MLEPPMQIDVTEVTIGPGRKLIFSAKPGKIYAREFFERDGQWLPTKRGLRFSRRVVPEIVAAFAETARSDAARIREDA